MVAILLPVAELAMPWRRIGILLFAAVVGLNVAGLMIDAALYSTGAPTVSEWLRRNQWAVAIVMALNGAGLLGLAMHFSNGAEAGE
jgi:hypothetical protein